MTAPELLRATDRTLATTVDDDAPRAGRPVAARRAAAAGRRATSARVELDEAGAATGFAEALNAGIHPGVQDQALDGEGSGEIRRGAGALVQQAAAQGGQALPAGLRAQFEQSLDADLGGVRVHTDAAAGAASDAIGARAFAHGQSVFMAAGEYDPGSPHGAWLLAHEVAHTVQQRGAATGVQRKPAISAPGGAAEGEADRAASAMMAGRRFAIAPGSTAGIQRRRPGEPADPGDHRAAGEPAAPAPAVAVTPPTTEVSSGDVANPPTAQERAAGGQGGGPDLANGLRELASHTQAELLQAVADTLNRANASDPDWHGARARTGAAGSTSTPPGASSGSPGSGPAARPSVSAASTSAQPGGATAGSGHAAPTAAAPSSAGTAPSASGSAGHPPAAGAQSAPNPSASLSSLAQEVWYLAGQMYVVDRTGHIAPGDFRHEIRVASLSPGTYFWGEFRLATRNGGQSLRRMFRVDGGLRLVSGDIEPRTAMGTMELIGRVQGAASLHHGIAIIVSPHVATERRQHGYDGDRLRRVLRAVPGQIPWAVRAGIANLLDSPGEAVLGQLQNQAMSRITHWIGAAASPAGLVMAIHAGAELGTTLSIGTGQHSTDDEIQISAQAIARHLVSFVAGQLVDRGIARAGAGLRRRGRPAGAASSEHPPTSAAGGHPEVPAGRPSHGSGEGPAAASGGRTPPSGTPSESVAAASGGRTPPSGTPSESVTAASGGRTPSGSPSESVAAASDGRTPFGTASESVAAASGGRTPPSGSPSESVAAASSGRTPPSGTPSESIAAVSGGRTPPSGGERARASGSRTPSNPPGPAPSSGERARASGSRTPSDPPGPASSGGERAAPAAGGHSAPAGEHAPPTGGEHAAPASGEHVAPTGGEHAALAGGEHAAPAGGEHAAPAGGEHAAPASGEHAAPAGGEHAAPAGGEHGAARQPGHEEGEAGGVPGSSGLGRPAPSRPTQPVQREALSDRPVPGHGDSDWAWEMTAQVGEHHPTWARGTVNERGIASLDVHGDHNLGGRTVRLEADGFSVTGEAASRMEGAYRTAHPGRSIQGYSSGLEQTNQTVFLRARELARARSLSPHEANIVAAAATPGGVQIARRGFGNVTEVRVGEGAHPRVHVTFEHGEFPPHLVPHLVAVRDAMRASR